MHFDKKHKLIKTFFAANIYKIKNNGVFGKQMENVRNRVDVRLVKDDSKKYVKMLSHPTLNAEQFLMKK